MTTAVDILQVLGSFFLGVAGRVGIFLAAGVALLTPAVLLAVIWHAVRRRVAARARVRAEARWSPGHTWVSPLRGGALAVGVDEIAQRILPSATALELPTPGMEVQRGDPIAVIRAGRRAIRIGAPVGGTVVAVNRRARRNPGLVKADPYGAGWLFRLVPRDELWRSFPGGAKAEAWLAAERRRLAHCLEEQLGIAAADGGELVEPAPALLGEEGWKRVVQSFLHAA
jgi:glycine cleavage system H lipoate-binding protein